ncbi:glycoside hydrolase family 1 protein [Enterococcus gallinarum]|uniref:glycoside hydrolase family 1 protein n=1 Tax=Enterococcus gallinarum TaxID=1353 RepID=UPI003D6AD47B
MANEPKMTEFLWGASTSAFQVEGAYLENGKGLSIADVRSLRAGNGVDTKLGANHYHQWREDIQLMKELGLKSYRFSINWTRIFPNGTELEPNEHGLAFYHELIDELLKNGIEPLVTIYHFDQPMGLIKAYGGWVSRKSIDDFFKYGKCLLKEFGHKVQYWLTINEQSVLAFSPDMLGVDTTQEKTKIYQQAYQANYHMWLAQAKVIALCHKMYPKAKIGPAVSYLTTLPATKSAEDMMAAKDLEDFYSFSQMQVALRGEIPKTYMKELIKAGVILETSPDDQEILKTGIANFLGINWYCTTIIKSITGEDTAKFILQRVERIKNHKLKYTDWGWNFDPVGLHYALRQIEDRFPGIPVAITECGWSQKEQIENGKIRDTDRIEYLQAHIHQMLLAKKEGVNVISFNPWSFLDVLSVGDGFEKRYGLIYVEGIGKSHGKMRRIKKDSFQFYKEMIAKNGSD